MEGTTDCRSGCRSIKEKPGVGIYIADHSYSYVLSSIEYTMKDLPWYFWVLMRHQSGQLEEPEVGGIWPEVGGKSLPILMIF